nr:hypothetical protein GCM10010200_037090 [Actinomadura rugatobispora]
MRPGGRLFGSTVLSRGVHLPLHTRLLLRRLNSDGRFNNTADSLDDLHAQLRSRFSDYTVTVHGCTALFEATVP